VDTTTPDDDLVLLEAFLDEALDDAEAAGVRARLAGEPALAGALDELRAERAVRQGMFAAMEPGRAEADRFAAAVLDRVAEPRDGWVRRLAIVRWAAALAACVLVGLVLGAFFYARYTSTPVAKNPAPNTGNVLPAGGGTDRAAGIVFKVELRDRDGRVRAVQAFDSLDEAKAFSEELERWQRRQEQIHNGGSALLMGKM